MSPWVRGEIRKATMIELPLKKGFSGVFVPERAVGIENRNGMLARSARRQRSRDRRVDIAPEKRTELIDRFEWL